MLKKYSSALWKQEFQNESWFSAFHDPGFLSIHASIFRSSVAHFTFQHRAKTVIAISTFESRGELILPDHFLYTGFWIDPALSEAGRLMALNNCLDQLKEIYKSITFRLPVDIADIRPFIWRGFSYKNLYTHILALPCDKFSLSIQPNSNEPQMDFSFRVETDFNLSSALHKSDLESFGYRDSQVNKYMSLCDKLSQSGQVVNLSAYDSAGNILTSASLLLDLSYLKAYLLLLSRPKNLEGKGIHTKMYKYIFNWLRQEGYRYIDLFGANMEGIAIYKSRFNGELFPFYQVSYNSRSEKE